VSFYVSTATFFLLHCDEWDRVVALPRHKFVTGATLLQLGVSPLQLVNLHRNRRYFVDTTLYSKVCQWLAACGWFSLGTPVSSSNKTDHHVIAEILLKVALNTITLPPKLKFVWFELTALVVIGTDCTGNWKSNYHTIMATTAPL
jgi:hypothetical protein